MKSFLLFGAYFAALMYVVRYHILRRLQAIQRTNLVADRSARSFPADYAYMSVTAERFPLPIVKLKALRKRDPSLEETTCWNCYGPVLSIATFCPEPCCGVSVNHDRQAILRLLADRRLRPEDRSRLMQELVPAFRRTSERHAQVGVLLDRHFIANTLAEDALLLSRACALKSWGNRQRL
jgi:hypothetical protein